jgi:bifunctional non-homologous end joining protein LigD
LVSFRSLFATEPTLRWRRQRLRRKPSGKHVFLYAFDLLELDGQDLRREPLETRKATLASLLRRSPLGLRLNEHLAHDGELVFRHACKMGLEGIVSKRLGSRYHSAARRTGSSSRTRKRLR